MNLGRDVMIRKKNVCPETPPVEIVCFLFGFFFYYSPTALDFTPVCPGSLGRGQPEGHADAVQRNPILVEKGQTRLCEFK